MKRLLGFIGITALTTGITLFFSRYGVDPHHDGIFLKPAVDMLHGQRLFTDSFSIYGPLTSVVHYLSLRMFGEFLIIPKIITAITYGLIAGLLFLISSSLLPFGYALLSILIWIAMAPYYEVGVTFYIWPSVFSLLFQLLSVLFLTYWIKNKKVLFLILGGLCAGITFWFRQPVGALLYASVILFFIIRRKNIPFRTTLPFHISFFMTHLIALVTMTCFGVLKDWFFQSVIFISWWHKAVSGNKIYPLFVLEKLFPLSFNAISIWVVLPASAFYVLWKKIKKPELILLALVSLASWAQYYPMSDIHHNYWAATPLFPLIIAVGYYQSTNSKKRLLIMLFICILFFPDCYNRLRMARKKVMASYVSIQHPSLLKGMLVEKSKYEEIQTIEKKIQEYEKKNPTGLVITNGQRALYPLFAKNKTNCHPFTSNWGWDVYNHRFYLEYIKTIEACRRAGALILK